MPITSLFFGLQVYAQSSVWGIDPTGWQDELVKYIGRFMYSLAAACCFASIALSYRDNRLREYRWLSFCGLLFFNVFTIILGVFGSIALLAHWWSSRDEEPPIDLIDAEHDPP